MLHRLLLLTLFYMAANADLFAQIRFYSDQIQGYELTLTEIKFDSSAQEAYAIPLRKFGLKGSNYSVIVTAYVQGDSIPYHIPGNVQGNHTFGLRLKAGRKGNGDTLTILRRTGNRNIVFSKVKVLSVRNLSWSGLMALDKSLSKFLISQYIGHATNKNTVPDAYFSSNEYLPNSHP